MAYLNETGLARVWSKLKSYFVAKSQTLNGKALSGNIVLKSADFAESVTNQKMLANLTYTEPRENSIRVAGKTIAGEYVEMSYGKMLSEVINKGTITADPASDAALIALADGTYRVSLESTTRFPLRYGVLFISSAGTTYKMFMLLGTTGGLWYRVANSTASTWYDSWVQAALKSDFPSVQNRTYTPTFRWGNSTSSGPEVSVVSSQYTSYGNCCQIRITFEVSNVNAPGTANTLAISLPDLQFLDTGNTYVGHVYGSGTTPGNNYLVRCTDGVLRVVTGTAAGTVSDRLTTGRYAICVNLFLS